MTGHQVHARTDEAIRREAALAAQRDVLTRHGVGDAELAYGRSSSPDGHQHIRGYDAVMRTTVTLDPDAAALVQKAMRERRVSFKEAVNTAIRAGLGPAQQAGDFKTRTFDMGPSSVPLDKALALAGELEDEEILRKLALGK